MSAIDGKISEESGALKELADGVTVITSFILKLVDGYADLNSLSILNVTKHLFIDGTLLDHLHKGVKEELVGVRSLLLVGLKLLLELSGN